VWLDRGMKSDELAEAYVDAMNHADVAGVLTLFAPDGAVHSPLYGTIPATDFYPALFKDTSDAKLSLRASMSGTRAGHDVVSLWLDSEWAFAPGESQPYMSVDVAELDDGGKITQFYVVFDSAALRDAFDRRGK
jgi:hypothetical protein